MKHAHSGTITTPREQLSQTGMQAGELGFGTRGNSEAAAWLAKHSPFEVDQAVALRASQLNVFVRPILDSRMGADGQIHYFTKGCIVSGSDVDITLAADELQGFMTAAPEGVIEGWLAELSVITARKQGDEFEEGLRLRAYATRLADYPADVARYACLTHSWRFWPSWAEMEEVCNAKRSARLAIIRALERELIDREKRAEERARAELIERQRAARKADRERQEAEAKAAQERCSAYIARHFPDVAERYPEMAVNPYDFESAQIELLERPDMRAQHPEAFA